jgi:hypothetical protein
MPGLPVEAIPGDHPSLTACRQSIEESAGRPGVKDSASIPGLTSHLASGIAMVVTDIG